MMMRKKLLILCLLAGFLPGMAKKTEHSYDYYMEWAERIADSEMRHNEQLWTADFRKKPQWDYTQGLVAKSLLELYKNTARQRYLDYVSDFADFFIDSTGSIMTYRKEDYNIDRINGGIFLFDLYGILNKPQYKSAIDSLRSQLYSHPRVEAGAFWHKKVYPHQVWLDGIYMGVPFYARYCHAFDQAQYYDDVALQITVADQYTRDPKIGLNYHGWDERKEQAWSDKESGCSPNFWSRSIGWYCMAIVDVLDYLPADHKDRQQLIDILNRVCHSLLKYQEKKTRMWYQVTDMPKREGNYLESSGSTMFCYAMAKGARKGYLPPKYLQEAREIFDGLCAHSTQSNADGTTSITRACAVAGLGGNPYRSGSYAYYISEPVRNDDPKVVGPFILAALELAHATPHIVVAKDGSGDYRSLQAAINAVPDYRKSRTIIYVKPGVYKEKVVIPASKQLLSIIGSHPDNTLICYDNYAGKASPFNGTLGTSGSATLYVYPEDLYMENISIANTAGTDHALPGGGTQAVAAHVSADRVMFVNCRFLGNQDTLFTYRPHSRQYYKNCYIEGTTDFIFGWASAVFDQCIIHSKKDSYITAASTPEDAAYGYLFYRCRLTADSLISKVYLGRPWRVYAKTVFMECDMGGHIRPEGWHNWNKPLAEEVSYYGEYRNYGAGSDLSQRVAWSKKMTAEEAEAYSLENILAGEDGWAPQTGIIRYEPIRH